MILKSKTENYYTATARNVITISISNQSLNVKSTKKYSNSICVINDSCLAEHVKATTTVNNICLFLWQILTIMPPIGIFLRHV